MTFDSDSERRRILGTLLPGLAGASLLDALLAVEALLVSQEHHGAQRWRGLGIVALLGHLRAHVAELLDDLARVDSESRHLTAAHVAARALMVLQRLLEPGE